jgi:hypothetical protein
MTPSQCRAARGLLNWTQDEMASAARLSVVAVRNFENEKSTPQRATLDVHLRRLASSSQMANSPASASPAPPQRGRRDPPARAPRAPVEPALTSERCRSGVDETAPKTRGASMLCSLAAAEKLSALRTEKFSVERVARADIPKAFATNALASGVRGGRAAVPLRLALANSPATSR